MDNRDASLDTLARPAATGCSLRRLLEDARSRLIQTGTRNRLVHCARNSARGKFVDIVEEKSDEIFRILVRKGRRLAMASAEAFHARS